MHYTGSILADIRRAVNADLTAEATISDVQGNGAYGVYQALVTIPAIGGGETRYRLLLAPHDAPLGIVYEGGRGHPADDHFTNPLVPA